jgi:hypothetical protein
LAFGPGFGKVRGTLAGASGPSAGARAPLKRLTAAWRTAFDEWHAHVRVGMGRRRCSHAHADVGMPPRKRGLPLADGGNASVKRSGRALIRAHVEMRIAAGSQPIVVPWR